MELNYKELGIGIAVVAALNVAWVYLFSLYGIGFADVFDLNIAFKLATVTGLVLAIAIGALIAAAVFTLTFFCQRLGRNEMLIMAVVGGAVPLVVGLAFYRNLALYAMLMAFYLAGLVWIAWERPKPPAGIFPKIGFGWGMPKKVAYMRAIGFFATTLIFTYQDLPKYQEKVKDSMINMTGGMNIQKLLGGSDMSSFISRDDVRSLVLQQQMTRDEVKAWVTQQYAGLPMFAAMTAEQQAAAIETATDEAYNKQAASLEQTVDATYAAMQDRFTNMDQSSVLSQDKMKEVFNRVFDQIPFMGALFQLLPVFMGVFLASSLLFLESVFIAPFTALMAIALPASPEMSEIDRLKKEIAELKKK